MKHKYAKWLALLCTLALALSMVPAVFAEGEGDTPTTDPAHQITIEGAAGNANGYYDFDFGEVTYSDKLDEVVKSFTIKVAPVKDKPSAQSEEKVKVSVSAVSGGHFEVKQVGTVKDATKLTGAQEVPEKGLVVIVALKDSTPNEKNKFYQDTLTIAASGVSATSVTVKPKVTVKKAAALKADIVVKNVKPAEAKSLELTDTTTSVAIATGEMHINKEIADTLKGSGFKPQYAAVKAGAAVTETAWQDNIANAKATEKGTYVLYGRIVGGTHYLDSDPFVLLENIQVKDSKITVTLDGGKYELPQTSFETGLDKKIDTEKLPKYDTTLKFKVENWYIDKGLTSKYMNTALTTDSTLYAKWVDKEITTASINVKFDYKDKAGTLDNGTCLVEKTKDSDNNDVILFIGELKHSKADPTTQEVEKNGKKVTQNFAGWKLSNGSEKIKQGDAIEAGATLVPVWEDATTEAPKPNDNKKPVTPSTPSTSTTPTPTPTVTPSNPSTSTPNTNASNAFTKEGWTASNGSFTHKNADGTLSKGSCWIEGADGVGRRYLFDNNGVLVTKAGQAAAGITSISADGDVLMNGNLYYLNPNRNQNDPRTCYVMTNYLRIRPNYAGQTWYDQDGITFVGWMKGANGGLRYQTRISDNYYLIVWRAQTLPASQHPDHPGDAAYNMPAGRYFFDDEGALVLKEGWNDGKDGKEYYTNASGQITQERAK